MDSRYIRGQALTLTKAHEERAGPLMGIASSVKKYGHDGPAIVFSDDPIKVCGSYLFINLHCDSQYFLGQAAPLHSLSRSIQGAYSSSYGTWVKST